MLRLTWATEKRLSRSSTYCKSSSLKQGEFILSTILKIVRRKVAWVKFVVACRSCLANCFRLVMALLDTKAMNFELLSTAIWESPSPARWFLQDAIRKATDCSPYSTHLEESKKFEMGNILFTTTTNFNETYSSTALKLSSVRSLALPSFIDFKICAAPRTAKRPSEFVCKRGEQVLVSVSCRLV